VRSGSLVQIRAVVDTVDPHGFAGVVDPVQGAIGAAPGTELSGKITAERFTDAPRLSGSATTETWGPVIHTRINPISANVRSLCGTGIFVTVTIYHDPAAKGRRNHRFIRQSLLESATVQPNRRGPSNE
jgi:hypothetical protein